MHSTISPMSAVRVESLVKEAVREDVKVVGEIVRATKALEVVVQPKLPGDERAEEAPRQRAEEREWVGGERRRERLRSVGGAPLGRPPWVSASV